MLGISLIAMACSKNDEASSLEMRLKKSTDPVLLKYAELGHIEKIEEPYNQKFLQCKPSLGVYLFIPDHGPFAGEPCEIYRYAKESDISSPCGSEFIYKYEENTLQGQKFVDCPNDGNDCYTFQGPNSCVIVHCDEKEV